MFLEEIFKQIAKEQGITPEEVKREIEFAIQQSILPPNSLSAEDFITIFIKNLFS